MFTITFGDYTFPNLTFEIDSMPHKNRIGQKTIIQQHGRNTIDQFLDSRRLKIKGTLHSGTVLDTRTQLDDMMTALLFQSDELAKESDRYINAQILSIKDKNKRGSDRSILDIQIDALAADPFFYATGVVSSTLFGHTGGTDTFNVINGGAVFAEPIIYVVASAGTINTITITNQSNNDQSCTYNGEIPNGATLTLNTSTLDVFVNGANGITNFGGDFIDLIATTNTLQVVGITCNVTVEWRNRWL